MCGRYYRIADQQAIAEQYDAAVATGEPPPPGYKIAPSTTQAVIRQGRDSFARELVGPVLGSERLWLGRPGPEASHLQRQIRKPREERSL
jgi:putative SOS response-associated peptidase YedK